MKKKAGILAVAFIMLLCMFCVWPFALVRKDTKCETGSTAYLTTNREQTANSKIEQIFIAQESVLKQIAFAVHFEGESCDVTFRLEDKEGKILKEQQIQLSGEDSDRYYYVDTSARLKKGQEYSWTVEIQNAEQVMSGLLYTSNGEITARGNDTLYVDGEYCEGQAVTSYTYAAPLNTVNVLCLWAFIGMTGFSVLGILDKQKDGKVFNKAEEYLEKYQNVILIAEMLVVTGLVVRSCFTQAVDWDEAYTWDIVKNNSFLGVIRAQSIDNHPPLYFLLVKIAALLFGDKIMVYKLVSVAGMLASMVLCATLLKKRWGVKAAVPTVLVLGLAPNFIFYNINVRMYSWMTFFVLAAALIAYEITQNGGVGIGRWTAITVMTLGGIYTQYFAVVPLFIIYVYLLIYCWKNKTLKKLAACCAAVVILYLPQLYLILKMLQRDGNTVDEGLKASLNIGQLCNWSFATNIKWSSYIPAAAYVLAVVLLIISWKGLDKKRKAFLGFTAAVYPVTWLICWGISQKMNHFWHNRYMLDALLFAWLFIALIYSMENTMTWIWFCIWLGILCLSSYSVTYSGEMQTVPYIQDAKEKLAEVPEGANIIYNYDTYDTLYRYYLPDSDFLWYEDVDFSKLDGDYVYMISWGGGNFPQEEIKKHDITIEYRSFFQLEEGIADVALCKVHFKN